MRGRAKNISTQPGDGDTDAITKHEVDEQRI